MSIREFLSEFLSLGQDKVSEKETIENIKGGVDFLGAKLWVLILAIFVASLGLNTNSTAVIIGAMLISPLMGPIIGMGLSVGINDFSLLKRAFRSYLIATIFSVATATLYFLVTPLAEAQSELLARTSPTIYDVAIALCGGLAGIIAISSHSQRTGNVIPGVAIATALMPPLCTVGFGLATGNLLYAAGAFYLYLINTIFIALATFIGVAFILRFHQKEFLDKQKEKHVKHIITAIAVVTIIPSLFITAGIIRETVFTQRCRRFCENGIKIEDAKVVSEESDYSTKTIRIFMIGNKIDSTKIAEIQSTLPAYDLEDVKLEIVQNAAGLDEAHMRKFFNSTQKKNLVTEEALQEVTSQLKNTKMELSVYQSTEEFASTLLPEIRSLYPEVTSISIGKGINALSTDSAQQNAPVTMVRLTVRKNISPADIQRLGKWLEEITGKHDIELKIGN